MTSELNHKKVWLVTKKLHDVVSWLAKRTLAMTQKKRTYIYINETHLFLNEKKSGVHFAENTKKRNP